jgi:F-type H+-transporting ATPase subunit delta
MNVSLIAIPYAKALFEHAKETGAIEETLKDMKVVAELCDSSKDFRMLLKSPLVQSEKKQVIFRRIFGEVISKMTFTFFVIIIKKKRESFIHDIALVFIDLYKEYKGILTVTLKTAVPATTQIRDEVKTVMKGISPGEIELLEEVKEELIGGFVLQWKDKQYDASINNQINRMQKGVAKINLYIKGI